MTSKSLLGFLEWFKRTSVCADCGWSGPAACFDFDHVPERGIKIGLVKQIAISGDATALWNEIAKCDVVCARCHRLRTAVRGVSLEARVKISQSVRGKSKTSTRPRPRMSQAAKEKISQSRKARGPETEASKLKRSEKMKELWSDPNYRARMKNRKTRGGSKHV